MGRAIQLVFADSFWIRTAYGFRKYLTADEVLLLFYLVNWSVLKRKENDWFFCRMSQIMDELHISQKVQSKLIRGLEEKGYIETMSEGFPPTRWIRINWGILEKHSLEIYEELQTKRDDRRKAQKKRNRNIRRELRAGDEDDQSFADEPL